MTGTDLHGAPVRLLNDLETLRRSLRLYPTSLPALQPARERIRARVLALADDGEAAVLSFAPDQLFWNGEKVSLPPTAPAPPCGEAGHGGRHLRPPVHVTGGGRGMLTREGTVAWLADRGRLDARPRLGLRPA